MMAYTQKLDVVVTLDDKSLGRVDRVVNALNRQGFVLTQSLDAIGVLTGYVPSGNFEQLSLVEGVQSVEREKADYHI